MLFFFFWYKRNCRLQTLLCTELVVSWHSWKMRSNIMSCNSINQLTNSGIGRLSTWLHATENYVNLHQSLLKIIWTLLNLFWLFRCWRPSLWTRKKGYCSACADSFILDHSTCSIRVWKEKQTPPLPLQISILFIDHSVFSLGKKAQHKNQSDLGR